MPVIHFDSNTMKPVPPVLRRLYVTAFLACLSPFTHAADKVDEWLKLLPEETLFVGVVKNAPEVVKDWDKSSFSRFLEDEAVKRWMAPAYVDGKAPWQSGEVAENFKSNLNVTTGGVLVAFMAKSAAVFDQKQPDGVILSDITGKESEHEKLMEKEMANAAKADAKSKQGDDEIEGVKVHYQSKSDAKDAAWTNSWAVVDGVAVQASNRAMMEYFVHALKTSSAGKLSGVAKGIGHLAEVNAEASDICFYVDLDHALALLKESVAKQGNKPGASPSPVPPEMIITALGLEELHGAGFTVDLKDDNSRIDFVLMHDENPKGLLPSFMRGTSTEVPQPDFVPADADAASVSRMSLGKVYDALMAGVAKLGPIAGLVTMQITQMEQQAGMSLRNDFLGSIDDLVIEVQDVGAPGAGSATAPDISKVDVFKLKDAERFKAAFETIKKLIGNGFGVFEESDFQGYTLYSLKSSLPTGEGNGNKFIYAITGDYFVFSIGKPDLLHRVLTRMKKPEGESFWDGTDVQQSIAALPKGGTGIGAQRGGTIISVLAQAIGSAQAMAPKKKVSSPKKSGPKGPKNGEEEDDNSATNAKADTGMFDPKAVPSEEVFKKYFGTSAVGMYALPDAIQYRFLAQPPVK
jgi:hypothetical protein